jgi:surface protein
MLLKIKSKAIEIGKPVAILAGLVAILACVIVLTRPALAAPSDDFVTTWKTDNPGTSSSTSITIPTNAAYAYSYDVDWDNDGTFDQFGITGDVTHDFGVSGTYTIRIQGSFPSIYFNSTMDRQKILSIDQWGTIAWSSMYRSYNGCTFLQVSASDSPDLSGVTSMEAMFEGAGSVNASLNSWNTANIANMNSLFATSNFNGDISSWNTASVTNMGSMFASNPAFNQDLSGWDVSSVTDASGMFSGATNFNQNIGGWNTGSVADTSGMFSFATDFNQDISGWNMSSVGDMTAMFAYATSFNQNIGGWNVSAVTDMTSMFDGVTLSTNNYDLLLAGWSAQALQSGVVFSAGNSQYCNAADRASIVISYAWLVTDGGPAVCSAPVVLTSAASNITATSATASAIITSDGGGPIIDTGLQYGPTTSYGNTASIGAGIVGDNPIDMLNLNYCTTFHYRAFATNAFATSYGSDQSFSTLACSGSGGGGIIIPGDGPVIILAIPSVDIPAISLVTPSVEVPTIVPSPTGVANALDALVKLAERIPAEVAASIPYLFLLILLGLAALYALQSYREYKSIGSYDKQIARYKTIQLGGENFIAITSHYLNTPIGIIQFSSELLLTAGIITKQKAGIVAESIKSIRNSAKQLIESSGSATEDIVSEVDKNVLKSKVRISSIKPAVFAPVIIAGLLIALANLIFFRAEVIDTGLDSIIIQSLLLLLVLVLIILAYRSLVRNKYLNSQRQSLVKAEQDLMNTKVDFINTTANKLYKNIVLLKSISVGLKKDESVDNFVRGIAMLSSIESSFSLLARFTNYQSSGFTNSNDAKDILTQIIAKQKANVDLKHLHIKKQVDSDFTIDLDQQALIMLIGSTVSNAVKFSKDGGAIDIEIKNKREHVLISIKDQGLGIAKDKLDQIMMPFVRATDVLQYDYEGIGLALYLDRIILDQSGGSIDIISKPNEGTTVEIKVPKLQNSHPGMIYDAKGYLVPA